MPPPRPVMRVFWTLHRVFRRLTGGRVGTSHATERRLGTLFLHRRADLAWQAGGVMVALILLATLAR